MFYTFFSVFINDFKQAVCRVTTTADTKRILTRKINWCFNLFVLFFPIYIVIGFEEKVGMIKINPSWQRLYGANLKCMKESLVKK